MNLKNLVIAAFFISAVLSGCSSNSEVSDDTEANQSETNDQASEVNDTGNDESLENTESKDHTQVDNEDGNSDEDTSDNTADSSPNKNSSDSTEDGIERHSFNSAKEATNYIKDYRTVEQTNVDLGHGIQASQDAGAGHQYIVWNEGNWLIKIDYPNNPQNAPEKYPDNMDLATTIVDYLENHYLPAPKDKGVIKIRGFKDSPQTLIQWQKDQFVYVIESNKNNPMETIKKAVDSGKELKNQ
ncbi:hypothetical protein Q7A53_07545 [Halobacillus rhizosphaerae]|uniref:hypothetical protein n=1 Tax=Halobacillus rhizosphaerae TaxID=3064889 RepID=UPI00398A56C2